MHQLKKSRWAIFVEANDIGNKKNAGIFILLLLALIWIFPYLD